MLRIYNTLTKSKEEFIPIDKNEVKMYVCGPTVYNDIHIGNARSMVAFDTIRRYLEYKGYNVKYVSNFTDIDDKIINRAKELKTSPIEIANRYIKSVEDDMKILNIKSATINPRATEYISDIKELIDQLIDNDKAYIADNGDIYFKVKEFENYGELSHQKLNELESGASQRLDDEIKYKQDVLDFALWKHEKDDEISFEYQKGKGRPGWHIECSAMVNSIFGTTIDIHGGGQDLVFPHHENERAQCEAVCDHKFANIWMHNGYVTVNDNEKMSKSLGNFTTVKEMVKKVNPEVVRFFMAGSQYRRPLQYSDITISEAQTNLNKIKETYKMLMFRLEQPVSASDIDGGSMSVIKDYVNQFIEHMDDDFNVANSLTSFYEFLKWINEYIRKDKVSYDVLIEIKKQMIQLMGILGIDLDKEDNNNDDQWILELIDKRNVARQNKDYQLSDQIRDDLKSKGILLKDTSQGTTYTRIEE